MDKGASRLRLRGSAGHPARPTGDPPTDLSRLDIVVAVRRDADGETLMRELQRTRARVRHCWPVPDRLPEDTDAMFVELAPDTAARVPWVPGEPKAALVAVAPPAAPPDLEVLKRLAADGILHRPIGPHAVAACLVQALGTFGYCQRLRGRIAKLDETLRSFRSVERAKAIIMRRNRMHESEAYQFLRRQAMDRRTSISAVAAAIIDAHEILD